MYDIEIKLLTENKKIIPMIYGMGELWTTNAKLPDIIIDNNDYAIIEIMQLEVAGICEEKEVLKLTLHKDEISTFIKQITPKINSMIVDGKQKRGGDIIFGKIHIQDGILTDKIELLPHECTIIPLSQMLYLNYTGRKVIDAIQLNIFVKGESGEQVVINKIILEQYKNKGKYIFPIKGKVCLANLPMSIAHRQCLSQEFAFDVVGQSDIENLILGAQPHDISNYYIYHENVMAIGDGIVVDIGDKFPESKMSNPNECSDEYLTKLFTELVPEIGFVNTLCGNYVVMDHENGEFSLYAHLSENTICVKKGDRVKQGTVVAKVGNTGNSTDPHLHFQLMDSPNMLEANGLPIMFEDINCNLYNFNMTEANSFNFSDLLYINIK